MNKNLKTGKIGENKAVEYLINNKYKIISKNHKEKYDEIDIIAKHFNGTLVFVEVKTFSFLGDVEPQNTLMPEDNLTRFKFHKIVRGCMRFAAKNPYLINEEKGWQIDLIAVLLWDDGTYKIRHYENI